MVRMTSLGSTVRGWNLFVKIHEEKAEFFIAVCRITNKVCIRECESSIRLLAFLSNTSPFWRLPFTSEFELCGTFNVIAVQPILSLSKQH